MIRSTMVLFAALAMTLTVNTANAQNPAYQITIAGTASGWNFTRSGVLVLARTVDRTNVSRNGVNPLEVGIVSGNPMISPERGAIQFATNVGLLGARSQLDITTVGVSGNTITIDMAPNISYASSFVGFNVTSGLTANFWFITSGRIIVTVSPDGRSVSGTINLSGRGSLYGNASYSARFSGIRIQ